jgi:putative SOS response-associated peptidase YedK
LIQPPAPELESLLQPPPEEMLSLREVNDAVNDVRADGPQLLDPPLRLF